MVSRAATAARAILSPISSTLYRSGVPALVFGRSIQSAWLLRSASLSWSVAESRRRRGFLLASPSWVVSADSFFGVITVHQEPRRVLCVDDWHTEAVPSWSS